MVAPVAAIVYAAHLVWRVPGEAEPPLGALMLVPAAYFLGALVGGWIAARISGRAWTAWLVGAVAAAGAIWSMFLIPHPAWMQIAAVVAPLLGALVAGHLGAARPERPA
jgi:nitrate/nitrite transporter NarK